MCGKFSYRHVKIHKRRWNVGVTSSVQVPEPPPNSNLIQSWIFIGRTDAELKLQYSGHLMWGADSLENSLLLGKIEGRRRRGRQRMSGWMASPTQWPWVSVNPGRQWRTGRPSMLQQRARHDWGTLQQQQLIHIVYGRNQYSIVKPLSPSLKKEKSPEVEVARNIHVAGAEQVRRKMLG